jgi:asparagine synthetase B (glutamine-hydrolysing)
MSEFRSKYLFHNKIKFKCQETIWQELKNGLWQQYNIDNHILNSLIPASQQHRMFNVFKDYTIIPPGVILDEENGVLKEDLYTATFIEMDKVKLLNLFESYFSQFTNKKIAVHLSGGLDSSIIIGLLNHFKIPFSLVGLESHRFEFRTEHTVQKILEPLGEITILIDMDDYPSFSNLSNRQLSQVPDDNIKQVEASKAVAFACKGIADVVFTGQGGDTLFVDSIPNLPYSWKCNINNEFIPSFEVEHLYPNEGIELISPFADKNIINAIYSLRIGLGADPLKKWARYFFNEILPRELSEYTYSADFFGTSLSGLDMAKEEIITLFETAYEITNHYVFSRNEVTNFLKQDVFDFEYQAYISYCNRISLAVWYNSLKREGYVK